MRNEDNHMSVRKSKYIIRGISLLHSIGTTVTINYFNVRETLLFFFGKITQKRKVKVVKTSQVFINYTEHWAQVFMKK